MAYREMRKKPNRADKRYQLHKEPTARYPVVGDKSNDPPRNVKGVIRFRWIVQYIRQIWGPGERFLLFIKLGVLVAAISTIVWQVSSIGLSRIISSLPDSTAFYALAVLAYLASPLGDMFIYTRLWHTKKRSLLPVMMRKRVFNEGILGYSGEAYLCLWATNHLNLSAGRILGNVRDVNLLSALTSTITAAALALWVASTTQNAGFKALIETPAFYLGVPGLLFGSLLATGISLRLRLGLLTPAQAARVLLIHGIRVLIYILLLITQWSVAKPDFPVSTWLAIITAQMVTTRLPMLPSQELVLVGVGIGISASLGAPADDIAALLLATGGTALCLHTITILTTTIIKTRTVDRASPSGAAG